MNSLTVFWILAAIAGFAAVGVVALDNPVRSAIALVVNFFTLSFLYFSLNAQLLGITQIMVYAGAIMVLFLFVIMLLNLGSGSTLKKKRDLKPLLGLIVCSVFFIVMYAQLVDPLKGITQNYGNPDFGTPQAVGHTLFSNYVWPFEVASVLLLVGIVGSILLAKRRI